MSVPVILAHGSLGPFDELIFLGVAVIFLTMMGISWVKSRNTPPDFEDDTPQTEIPTESADRFTLD